MLLQKRDKCTIKRPNKVVIEGETVWGEPVVIAENLPCLLTAKGINAVNQTQSTASIMYTFLLFTDTKDGTTINPNDTIEVTTYTGQFYKLKAGHSMVYPTTTQTTCEEKDVI